MYVPGLGGCCTIFHLLALLLAGLYFLFRKLFKKKKPSA